MLNKVYVYYVYFLVYLNVCGINPKEHGVKQELVSLLIYSSGYWWRLLGLKPAELLSASSGSG